VPNETTALTLHVSLHILSRYGLHLKWHTLYLRYRTRNILVLICNEGCFPHTFSFPNASGSTGSDFRHSCCKQLPEGALLFLKRLGIIWIWGSHSSDYEYYHNVVLSGRNLLMFRRNVLPISNFLPDCKAPCPKTRMFVFTAIIISNFTWKSLNNFLLPLASCIG
jgi:hypothetical protein